MMQLHVKHSIRIDPQDAARPNLHKYTVIKVTNSVTPRIDDLLSADQLTHYCDSADWNVTVT